MCCRRRWESIAARKTNEPVVLTLDSGERLYGWFESEGKEANEFLAGFAKQTIAPLNILAICRLRVKERQHADSFDKPVLRKHRLEAGAQVRSGKVDSTDATVGYQAQRQKEGAQPSRHAQEDGLICCTPSASLRYHATTRRTPRLPLAPAYHRPSHKASTLVTMDIDRNYY